MRCKHGSRPHPTYKPRCGCHNKEETGQGPSSRTRREAQTRVITVSTRYSAGWGFDSPAFGLPTTRLDASSIPVGADSPANRPETPIVQMFYYRPLGGEADAGKSPAVAARCLPATALHLALIGRWCPDIVDHELGRGYDTADCTVGPACVSLLDGIASCSVTRLMTATRSASLCARRHQTGDPRPVKSEETHTSRQASL
jgi:hypothetical protein